MELSNMQPVEKSIITELVKDMRAQGYRAAAVWDGGEYVMALKDGGVQGLPSGVSIIQRELTEAEVLEAVDAVFDSTIHFTYQHRDDWGSRGVLVILGNGKDVLSDYHSPENEPFSSIIDAIYARIEEGKIY